MDRPPEVWAPPWLTPREDPIDELLVLEDPYDDVLLLFEDPYDEVLFDEALLDALLFQEP